MTDTPAVSTGAYSEPAAHLRWRHLKDRLARHGVAIGGVTVLGALLLIFAYLLIEVAPLFARPSAEQRAEFKLPGDASATLYVSAEEQSEIGARLAGNGEVDFFELAGGALRKQVKLDIGARTVTSVAQVAIDRDYVAAGLSDGAVVLLKLNYAVSYPDDKRYIDPLVDFPYGPAPLPFLGEPVSSLSVREGSGGLLMAGLDAQRRLHLRAVTVESSLMGDKTITPGADQVVATRVKPDLALISPSGEWLYAIDLSGQIGFNRVRGTTVEPLESESVGARIVATRFLAGGNSLIVADETGRITQFFPARRAETTADGDSLWYLARARSFQGEGPATALGAEQRRRVFAAADAQGHVTLYHATAQKRVMSLDAGGPVAALAFEPRARSLLALKADGSLRVFAVNNRYPEISWSALWDKVWYEGYDEPRQLWQSSAANSDFEPKFSFAPLTLGTIKGAFYAMIFAVPLAVLGAVFTANFMAPRLRQVVKPTVEVMQALPTVVLGFLAGLWLAPFVETYLPGVFLTLILLPLSIPVAGYFWGRMPERVRYLVPAGWEAVLLIPVVIAVVWLCFLLAQPLETIFFAGNMQAWLDHRLGIGYDQRNCLVVGIAMGVAVIPGIFSIAEDAIFSVPKQLTLGSLALGATPWQTLVGVVLPTASPGIFSAIMIGLGRAVGETMIVLMATGNTAVMDVGPFSGMRTLSANIAVEMPESEVGSAHFRLLFLAGLVLFVFTFAINTAAEVVRQRLRDKYGNL